MLDRPRSDGERTSMMNSMRTGDDPRESNDMAVGTVKWFNTTRGYGFIQPEDGGRDVFVHATAVERSGLGRIDEGQKLAYDLEKDRRTGKESATDLRAV
jgi:CspA family cold shock protein